MPVICHYIIVMELIGTFVVILESNDLQWFYGMYCLLEIEP